MPSFNKPLADRLASQVRGTVRSRGRTYFRNGSVFQTAGGDTHVQAVVRGSRPYEVYVGVGETPDVLDASCTCPFFDDRFDICKHIWAVILYADRHRLLRAAREVTDLLLLPELSDDADTLRGRRIGPGRRKPGRPDPPAWRSVLARATRSEPGTGHRLDADTRQVLYLIDTHGFPRAVSVTVATRERRMDGTWGRPRPWRVNEAAPARVQDPRDGEILALLLGSDPQVHGTRDGHPYRVDLQPAGGNAQFNLREPTEALLLMRMCGTGRCFLPPAEGSEMEPLSWDAGPPWELRLAVEEMAPAKGDDTDKGSAVTESKGPSKDGAPASIFRIHGRLVRNNETLPLDDPRLRIGNAVALIGNVAAPAVLPGEGWTDLGVSGKPLPVPAEDREAFLEELLTLPGAPPLDLPPKLRVETVHGQPTPRLLINEPNRQTAPLGARLEFRYADRTVEHGETGARLYDRASRRLLIRDRDREGAAARRLPELGFRASRHRSRSDAPFTLPSRYLAPAVRTLVAEGWEVEAKGKRYRTPGEFQLQITSGIDWFDLDGSLQFGDTRAALPELLKAAAAGDAFVKLGDGTLGLLPEDWMAKYGLLGALGTPQGDRLRLSSAHVAVLDALLEVLPEARYDTRFADARRRLSESGGIQPASPPRTFRGRLREYQKEGLGWMRFLRDSGFGGCLADDMGLGKTVQVLALLDSRRRPRSKAKLPSLAVVPRSVLWNWREEAARFTPRLRVHIHAGPDRKPRFPNCDLVLTTYGTLHRDILKLQDIPFDYVILDEAQAVKNSRTGRAKAVRLLQARHRLALSGTPIENHIGELWSLFEFLNPGMLGSAAAFQRMAAGSEAATAEGPSRGASAAVPAGGPTEAPSPETNGVSLVARAVRPFVLRRTKGQVAPELPERSEQTILCELKGRQLRHYRELRDHYRASLMERVEEVGLGRSKIHVLEALLRLRQAACHPALIDPAHREEDAAKIEELIPRLLEVVEEGNKALVFSQFTRFLALVREHLDRAGVVYEYLDGRTRKRGEKVMRFQEDPDCPLFLISLKAGGLGLNLTAAGYVFLLDPWWNPAVEAQAIDRAHRIGQTQHVFAYRLIARDTVEERILQLQDAKRDLAASIITEDRSLMQKLRPEDLEVLLS